MCPHGVEACAEDGELHAPEEDSGVVLKDGDGHETVAHGVHCVTQGRQCELTHLRWAVADGVGGEVEIHRSDGGHCGAFQLE